MANMDVTTIGQIRPAIWNVTERATNSLLANVICLCFRMFVAAMMEAMEVA